MAQGLPKKYAKMGFKKGWKEYKKTQAYRSKAVKSRKAPKKSKGGKKTMPKGRGKKNKAKGGKRRGLAYALGFRKGRYKISSGIIVLGGTSPLFISSVKSGGETYNALDYLMGNVPGTDSYTAAQKIEHALRSASHVAVGYGWGDATNTVNAGLGGKIILVGIGAKVIGNRVINPMIADSPLQL